jgi:DNA polymerase-1
VPVALLLDTNALFFRAHYALPPMNTQSGEPTSAVYGFSALLLKLLREERPDGLGFARDLPKPTFRHERYAEYKAHRPPVPDSLRPQWRRLDALIEATGVPSLAVPGFEADDVLATAARSLSEAGHDVKIVTGDRDLFQTIGPRVTVMFVGARGQKPELIDRAAVEARYGVPPERMPMLSALIGESADNLVGVSGIGAKTASKLVSSYGTASALFADIDAVAPQKIRDALREATERVLMNEDLARLRTDLALPSPLVAPLRGEAFGNLRRLFDSLEFKSLATRLDALEKPLEKEASA